VVKNVSNRSQSNALIPIPSECTIEIDEQYYVCYRIVFQDTATPSPFLDSLFEGNLHARDGYIHLEGVLAGWGCCCLQVTFQAQSFTESLRLYDQLLPLTGIMVCTTR
jgi:hypothetical protein